MTVVLWISFFTATSLMLQAQTQTGEIRVVNNERVIVFSNGEKQPFDINFSGPDAINPQMQEKGTEENLYPIYNGTIEPNAYQISKLEEDLARVAERRAQLSTEAAQVAAMRAYELNRKYEELNQTINATPEGASEYQHLHRQYLAAQKLARESQREAQQASDLALEDKVNARNGRFMEQFMAERKKINKKDISQLASVIDYNNTLNVKLPFGEQYDGKLGLKNPTTKKSTVPCQFAFQGYDDQNKSQRTDLQKELLFTHTDDRLRRFLKDKPYLTCEAFISNLGGGRYYLVVEYAFAYDNAQEIYGMIEKNSTLMIKLLNGQFVNLWAATEDKGAINPITQLMTYQVHYPIDGSYLNLLRKVEMEKMVVFWSSAFEEYEVFQMDFFIKQLNCLN